MFYYTFKQNDTFYNRIETHPYAQFYINDSKIYYNNKSDRSGMIATQERMVPGGHISLYELNIDRPSDSMIHPFITKGGSRTAFRTVSTNAFQSISIWRYNFRIIPPERQYFQRLFRWWHSRCSRNNRQQAKTIRSKKHFELL